MRVAVPGGSSEGMIYRGRLDHRTAAAGIRGGAAAAPSRAAAWQQGRHAVGQVGCVAAPGRWACAEEAAGPHRMLACPGQRRGHHLGYTESEMPTARCSRSSLKVFSGHPSSHHQRRVLLPPLRSHGTYPPRPLTISLDAVATQQPRTCHRPAPRPTHSRPPTHPQTWRPSCSPPPAPAPCPARCCRRGRVSCRSTACKGTTRRRPAPARAARRALLLLREKKLELRHAGRGWGRGWGASGRGGGGLGERALPRKTASP